MAFSRLVAHPADHQFTIALQSCMLSSDQAELPWALFVCAGFSISFDCFTSITLNIIDQLWCLCSTSMITGWAVGGQGLQIDLVKLVSPTQMQPELMKLGVIYWTGDDCDGQVDLKLHLSVGQVLLFHYFDHCRVNSALFVPFTVLIVPFLFRSPR